jgi:hypothetical protein
MKIGTSTIALAISAVLIGLTPLAVQAQAASSEVTSAPGKVGVSHSVKMTATVSSIDMGTREVLLTDEKGKQHRVTVSEEARNLGQVKVGDKVTAVYTEAISLQLKKQGAGGAEAPPPSGQAAMVRTPAGAKPGGAVGRQITAIATVVNVNTKKKVVTLKGPEGNEFDVDVADPEQLAAVTKGDHVEVTYTEALALSVQPAPGPK